MNTRLVSIISRSGAIIISTLASFIIKPPVISVDEIQIIDWKNIFIFFSGILSILLFDRFKNKKKLKPFTFYFLSLIVALLIIYELLFYKYSALCFDQIRCVVSYSPVKSDVAKNLSAWKNKADSISALLEAYRCSSKNIWSVSDLAWPYFGMLFLYLAIIVVLTLLLVSISDLIKPKK